MATVRHARGTRAALDALATGGLLVPWQLYALTDENRVVIATSTSTYQALAKEGEGGVTDHGALTGLADDDHPQYLTDARGDARYSQLGHTHAISDVTGLQAQITGLASSKLDVAATSFGGNAATATKLQTARTLTIGDTGKNVDGSANVSWSLAEIGAARFAVLASGTDLNTVVNPGFYKIYTLHGNAPAGVNYGQLIVARGGGDTILQIVTGFNNGEIYWRQGNPPDVGGSGSWSVWRRFFHSGNLAAATEAAQGIVELATVAEAKAGTDTVRAVTPAGAMGLVNQFGLGGAAASVPGNNIDNNAIPTGFYYVTSTTSGTKPAGDDGFGHLIVSREGGGTTARQLYLDNTSARISTRVYVNAAWSEWRDIYHVSATHNIVGLVQVATGGGAGTYVRIDDNFAPKPTDAAFFNNHPTYAGIVDQTIDGQSMIKIPKFYFKAGTVPSGAYAGKAYWMISDRPAAGFSVHPAFIGAGGVELDQIWVGKYQASASGGKLQSVPGVLPRVSLDFPTARAEAYARNTGGVSGFRLWSYYDLSAIQMLATIEMGGLDMQALIGQGRVSQSSAANVDAADVAQATWRGIVGLWGNVYQMVDGIKRGGGNWWRWQYNVPGSTTTSDFATGYINTGRSAPTTSGYPVTFDTTLLSAGIIVPATVDVTASNGSTGDYLWSNTNTDDRIVYHGGYWSSGVPAGLFSMYAAAYPSYAYGNIGCRLAKV